jgi:hypothetical protein
MCGTLSYFNFDRTSQVPVGPSLRRALCRFWELLSPGGILILSNWSFEATQSRDLLAIYESHDLQRLASWTPPTTAVVEALSQIGFDGWKSMDLGRLALIGCQRPAKS